MSELNFIAEVGEAITQYMTASDCTDANGEIHKYFRKEWNRNENGIMDLVMQDIQRGTITANTTNQELEDQTDE